MANIVPDGSFEGQTWEIVDVGGSDLGRYVSNPVHDGTVAMQLDHEGGPTEAHAFCRSLEFDVPPGPYRLSFWFQKTSRQAQHFLDFFGSDNINPPVLLRTVGAMGVSNFWVKEEWLVEATGGTDLRILFNPRYEGGASPVFMQWTIDQVEIEPLSVPMLTAQIKAAIVTDLAAVAGIGGVYTEPIREINEGTPPFAYIRSGLFSEDRTGEAATGCRMQRTQQYLINLTTATEEPYSALDDFMDDCSNALSDPASAVRAVVGVQDIELAADQPMGSVQDSGQRASSALSVAVLFSFELGKL